MTIQQEVRVFCARFPYLANNQYYLTFSCLSPSLSTHKPDPDPPANSDRSQELNSEMSMNSDKLEKKIAATVCVLWTCACVQIISIS